MIAHFEMIPMEFQTVRADRVLEIMPALHGCLQIKRKCSFLRPEESAQHIQPLGGVQFVGGRIEPRELGRDLSRYAGEECARFIHVFLVNGNRDKPFLLHAGGAAGDLVGQHPVELVHKTVEASILKNAIDTINALKQAEIETALEEIETLIKQAEMEQAEASCLELLESGNLSAEQEQMANDYLNDIALMCFAGTYIVLPDYITGRDAERVTGATVEKILNGGQAFVDFYYKREGDFKVAKDYYLSYLNSRFTLVSSDTRSTMLTTYIFCDADRNEFALNVISTTKVFDLNMELTNGLFDHSKLDSNNPDAGIWETSKAVLRK